ncbi:MAG: hypothetical protein Tsb0010_15170 [Parvularculaceae bacterium]
MTKSADAFRTISEAAVELDVPQHVLRFWESKFGQIRPMKRGGGRRYYRPADIELLRGVRTLLYEQGYTIKGVQKLFREQGARFVSAAGAPSEDEFQAAPAPADASAVSRRNPPTGGAVERLIALKARLDAAIKADRARFEGARSRARAGASRPGGVGSKKAGLGR